jgi:hypothetical protein
VDQNNNGDLNMDEGTVEEEKKPTQPNRTKNREFNSEKKFNWADKGKDNLNFSDKGDPNKKHVKGTKKIPKKQHLRSKKSDSATLPVITEAPKEKEH